jgi:hypothetical protein
VPIEALPNVFQREIEGQNYDLVYLGTAGTARNGNNTLRGRIKWHLCQEHNTSSICSGALSTLRSGLSALLLETALGENSRDLLNDFLCANFWIYWMEYDDINDVNSDERRLIDELLPLLNIKNNRNARKSSINNPTKQYRIRRNMVIHRDRISMNCSARRSASREIPSFDNQIIFAAEDCVEYTVLFSQDLSVVTKGISILPQEKCKIISITDSQNEDLVFDGWKFPASTGRNRSINNNAQNIYSYFSKTHKNKKRSTLIQEWMEEFHSEEIIIRVCAC